MTTTTEPTRALLRRLAAPVYVPIVSGTFGLAMLLPVLPLYLTEVGLSLGVASIVLASVGIGAAAGGLPVGALLPRVGDRAVMIGSLLLVAGTTALLGVTSAALALVALRVATGAGNVGLRLSRQSYITRHVDPRARGRAMSTIGGSFRVSLFLGPLLGGVLADLAGYTTTFVVAGAIAAVGTVPGLIDRRRAPGAPVRPAGDRIGIGATLRRHGHLLAVVGVVPLLVMTVREGRNVVIPLIGDDLGLSPTAIGVLVSVGTAADLLLFPFAGHVMDRHGRLLAMVPAFGLIAVGLVVLGLADTTGPAVVGGVVVGIGNGMSSGTMLTLGSDLAPDADPGPFLAVFGVIQDGGKIAGPLLVGLVGGRASLGTAALVLAAVMATVVVWLLAVVGETAPAASG